MSPVSLAHARQRGFTMVEIMVALTIGFLLTIVVSQLFLGSRRTYATTDDVSRIQEHVRYTYQLLTRTLHYAGHKTSPNLATSAVFPPGTALTGADGDALTQAPDTFTVAYQGSSNGPGPADNTVFDCLGNPIAGGATAANVFTIQVGANGANALFCNGVEVVPDVENMQVVYGEDRDAVQDAVANGYFNATDVTNMDNVRSIRVALLFRAPTVSGTMPDTTTTYDLNGVVFGPFNDARIRRAVTMTLNLRNRTP